MKLKYLIMIALMLSATAGLIYEVVVIDNLFFYFVRSSYSTATTLSVFLFGLGLGSYSIYKFKDKIRNKKFLFALFQITIGIYAFFVLTNLDKIITQISTAGVFVTSFALLLLPTICLGASFPLAGNIIKEKDDEKIGLVYSVDLIGAVIGTLIAGFFLIPTFGNKITILSAVILNFASAGLLLEKKKKMISIFSIILVSMFLISAQANQIDYFKKPSPYGEVIIRNESLFIDGREQCSIEQGYDEGEKAIVDYAVTSHNLDVLNIGLGCGLTLEKILEKTDRQVDIVEINPVVVQANKLMTDVLQNPRVNLIVDEGLNYLRSSSEKYDSIIIDIENPSIIHSSNLFTAEAFREVYNSLDNDGVFGLWVNPCTSQEYYDIIYYTLKESFPYVYKLSGSIFIASKQELDYEEYNPRTEKQINTFDKKVLSGIYLAVSGKPHML